MVRVFPEFDEIRRRSPERIGEWKIRVEFHTVAVWVEGILRICWCVGTGPADRIHRDRDLALGPRTGFLSMRRMFAFYCIPLPL